jgi:hypothetical protein
MSLTIDDININNNLQVILYIIGDIEYFEPYVDLSSNPNISINIVKKLKDKSWHWDLLTQNKAISDDDIGNNPELPWDYSYLSSFNILTEPDIQDFDKYLYSNIYRYKFEKILTRNISIELAEKINTKLKYCFFSRNQNITIEFLKGNLDKRWNYFNLTQNPAVTWDFVKNIPSIPWHKYGISSNPNITIDIIQNNPEYLWNWYELSNNPNLDWRFIYKNIDKISISRICSNLFEYHPHLQPKIERSKIMKYIERQLISDYRLCINIISLIREY